MSFTRRNEHPRLDRREANHSLFLAATGAALIAASFLWPWHQADGGPVLCMLRLTTGVPCPGCGLTRSFCSIAHGEFAQALGFHLLGPVLYLAVLIAVPVLAYQGITRRRVSIAQRALFSGKLAWGLAIVLMGYHAVRLVAMAWSGALWDGLSSSPIALVIRAIVA